MASNKKSKKTFADITGVEWKDLDHKKVYAALALLVLIVILVIALIVAAVRGGKDKTSQDVTEQTVTNENSSEAESAEEKNLLEVDAYEEINELVRKYFEGLSSGNTDLVEESVDVLTDEEKAVIGKKKDYIEAYQDVICYTKKGLEENSFVVFASYEMKIYNIETPAPGIMALYVCADENGDYYIFNGEASEMLEAYVLELAADEEVAAVVADVEARYQQLIEEDEDLGKFAQTMLASQEEADNESEESEEPEEPSEGDAKELDDPVKTTLNDGIRIREERSTDSAVLTTVIKGTEVGVYASFDDGWSKVLCEGKVGYCKTEFLTSTEGVPMLSAQTEETEEAEDAEETQEESSASQVNKKMQVTDTIRIRKERSTDSDVLKLIYKQSIVKVVENYSDGWSKIEYEGITGYCKTEYLADVN